jgi:hypothetical protein
MGPTANAHSSGLPAAPASGEGNDCQGYVPEQDGSWRKIDEISPTAGAMARPRPVNTGPMPKSAAIQAKSGHAVERWQDGE